MSDKWELIHVYTRAQAIADGVLETTTDLVPDEDLARQAGWKYPVALTAAVAGLVRPTEAEARLGQDLKGRLWDLLWMGCLAVRRSAGDGDTVRYELLMWMVRAGHPPNTQCTVRVKAVVGPGDEGEPVVTILLPEED